jgi:hypothetical protein
MRYDPAKPDKDKDETDPTTQGGGGGDPPPPPPGG